MMMYRIMRINGILLASCLFLSLLTACTGNAVSLHGHSSLPQDQTAILLLADSEMRMSDIAGSLNDGSRILSQEISPTTRSIEVMPGIYDVSLFYEHLAQSRCWEDGLYERCTRTLDRGWWLPGSTLIPGTVKWNAEAGKVYVIKRVEDYWSMAEHAFWNPVIEEHGEL